AGLMLPQTEQLAERVMTLPTGTAVGPVEISKICEIIRRVVAHSPEIHERLASSNLEFPRTAKPPPTVA
ncbi:MAG: hypothetical protein ACRD9S_09140, partial [Pyrinomonadaceae bacterium]